MNVNITFLGGSGTVTGSKYLVRYNGKSLLVDCGLFQGYKQLRLRNWQPLPVTPHQIDAVVLTHAHLDHSGYLPLLARVGYSHAIRCTPGTRDLCSILLPDSAHLQEDDAALLKAQTGCANALTTSCAGGRRCQNTAAPARPEPRPGLFLHSKRAVLAQKGIAVIVYRDGKPPIMGRKYETFSFREAKTP